MTVHTNIPFNPSIRPSCEKVEAAFHTYVGRQSAFKFSSWKDEEANILTQAIAAMVAAWVAPSNDRMPRARDQISATLKAKARRFIMQNLRSQRLGAAMLCRELGMSRSSIYRLLESEGGVVHFVQRLRLLETLAQLSDPSNRKTIAIIADELGLTDPSSFSRAFRRQFGISPSDARKAAQAGLGRSIAQTHQEA